MNGDAILNEPDGNAAERARADTRHQVHRLDRNRDQVGIYARRIIVGGQSIDKNYGRPCHKVSNVSRFKRNPASIRRRTETKEQIYDTLKTDT